MGYLPFRAYSFMIIHIAMSDKVFRRNLLHVCPCHKVQWRSKTILETINFHFMSKNYFLLRLTEKRKSYRFVKRK